MVSASTFAHMEHTEKSRQTDLAKASVAALRAASEFVSSTALYNRSRISDPALIWHSPNSRIEGSIRKEYKKRSRRIDMMTVETFSTRRFSASYQKQED